ncbi:hypothetical protein BYT27DRAFT_7080413, partial [Phlegmacium glaucopus]
TNSIAVFLDALFAVSLPDHCKQYQQTFKAGVGRSEDYGSWLGWVIVYDLQVKPHHGGLDGGPTAIFPVGSYAGGELYFTDLDLKFQ